MTNCQRSQKGSALLLTLLLTLVGAAFLGLSVDAMALVWSRSNAQTTANLVAASVAVELERHPSCPPAYLLESARATAAWNGFRHGTDAVSVDLLDQDGKKLVLIERPTGVLFLRMIRPQPVPVQARAFVIPKSVT